MIKIDDTYYYVDLEAISEVLEKDESLGAGYVEGEELVEFYDEEGKLTSTQRHSSRQFKPKEIDGNKAGMINAMVEVLLNEPLEFSQSNMKMTPLNQAPSNFILAFNSLLKLNILKKI